MLAPLILVFRGADEAFGQLGQGELLPQVRRQEQHQPQTAVDLAAGLERGALLLVRGHLLGIVLVLVRLAADGRGDHGGRGGADRFVGKLELRRRVEATMEGVHRLLRADDGGTGVLQHEHGQIIGIGVGDVEQFPVDVDGRRETSRINDLHQRFGNRLRPESRRDRVQSQSGDGGLRHARRGAGGMLLHLLLRGGRGDRHRAGQIVGGSQNRQILLRETQADAGVVAQLQTVGREILTFRLRRILRLARFDGDAHGGELGAVALELLGERGLGRLIGQLSIRVGVRLDSLRDLTGGQPLREG